MLSTLLSSYRAKDWRIALDGEDVSGNYILWEALNIRSVASVLPLTPQAETDDGALRSNRRA